MESSEDRRQRMINKAVQYVKDCGQELIDSAEKIVGGYEVQTGTVEIQISIDPQGGPCIKISNEAFPRQTVRRILSERKEFDKKSAEERDEI